MSPRPRKASDEEVFAATQRAMMRLGPTQLTLAEIAAEAGLTAGALVQRFGSKRGLMLAMMSQMADWPRQFFGQLRAEHASPLAALYAYADCFAQMGETPATLAHHLSYLQLDLTDPDFFEHTSAQARATSDSASLALGIVAKPLLAITLPRSQVLALLSSVIFIAASGCRLKRSTQIGARATTTASRTAVADSLRAVPPVTQPPQVNPTTAQSTAPPTALQIRVEMFFGISMGMSFRGPCGPCQLGARRIAQPAFDRTRKFENETGNSAGPDAVASVRGREHMHLSAIAGRPFGGRWYRLRTG